MGVNAGIVLTQMEAVAFVVAQHVTAKPIKDSQYDAAKLRHRWRRYAQ